MTQPWDQRPGEPATLYNQFLLYRNQGPGRSLRRAYRQHLSQYEMDVKATKGPSGAFKAASVQWDWAVRAKAWDADQLRTYGARLGPLYAFAIEQIADKLAAASRKIRPGDPAWKDILAAVDTVKEHLKVSRQAGADRPPAPQETPGVHPGSARPSDPAEVDRAAVE